MQEVLNEVLLPSTPDFVRRYPHQLSGGQQQRVGLAMAFACRPSVIVLDEPTTGLDVSTQAHVLATVRDLCRAHGVAALYVTHDLAVVANLADRVAVMYAGRVVEQGPTAELFAGAAHPYTRHLIAAVPDITGDREVVGPARTGPIAGPPPDRAARSLHGARRRRPSAGKRSRRSIRSVRTTSCAATTRARRSPTPARPRSRTSAAVTSRPLRPHSRSPE